MTPKSYRLHAEGTTLKVEATVLDFFLNRRERLRSLPKIVTTSADPRLHPHWTDPDVDYLPEPKVAASAPEAAPEPARGPREASDASQPAEGRQGPSGEAEGPVKASGRGKRKGDADDHAGPLKGNHVRLIEMVRVGFGKPLVRLNTFVSEYELTQPIPGALGGPFPRLLQDADDIALAVWAQKRGFTGCSRKTAGEVLTHLAGQNSFDPLRDWYERLPPWDGTPRLSNWLTDYAGAEPSEDQPEEYLRAVGRATLIGLAKRAINPGCKLDTMPILEGPQGTGKSRLIAALSPDPEWFTDSITADLGNKDARLSLRGMHVVEFQELQSISRSESEHLKAFLSTAVDRVRPHYGRRDVVFHRRCAIFGTTNRDDWAKDETGNRRFWPVKVTACNPNALERDRDQLFAEALAAARKGEAHWFSPDLEDMARRVQADRMPEPLFLDRVSVYLEGQSGPVHIGEVMTELGFTIKDLADGRVEKAVARCMTACGWKSQRLRRNGGRKRYWFRTGG